MKMNLNNLKPCTYPGCLAVGRWKPIVHVRTPDNDRTFNFDFQHCNVCDFHKSKMTLEDIIGGKVFAQLINMFKEKFIHPPKKEHCTLQWQSTTIPIFSSGKLIGQTGLIQ